MGKAIRDALEDWPTVDASLPERGLLLGNGASIALWPKFRYDSLFVVAQDVSKPEHLREQDVAVFSALETKNFEAVLSALIVEVRSGGDLCVNGRWVHTEKLANYVVGWLRQ